MPKDIVRLSVDVSAGTFNKISEICEGEHRKKADYIRLLIDSDFRGREGR